MKHLELIYRNSDSKLTTLRLTYAQENLTEAATKKAMQDIAALKMFDNNGVNPYVEPVAARYVETNTDPIFDTRSAS
ncbi:hypothetical protein FC56_GL001472 [Lentilactobacillus senioris DSM 24302 = JCM 17472]|uniref:DUF2922 domain-containing protein n=1 Tax=Lentilactobacillus senioris DSM 24302 = JCM 17472 TaxID=1423802 RepID=A0A0R2D3Y7_9LACO|nr:DUF2922 domain-containing protein [Lentilactobacillus senioris]KRM94515.1 hypothetical protein FC56_GL001472 [Lentilactobacillus senioris DSM 24302 = JCM 17472]